MSTRHIIQISGYYPPHLGGQENAVYDLSRQLAIKKHNVQVLTSTIGGGPKGAKKENGVKVTRLRAFEFGHAAIMPWFPASLYKAAKKGTTVHLHIGQAFTPEMVWLVSKLRRFKYIAQLHIDFEPSGPAGFLLPLYKKLILKRVLQSASRVITLNQRTLEIVRRDYGYKGKIQILNNGIDEDYFKLKHPPLAVKPPRSLRLLFVGRLSPQKNIINLIKALKLTKRPLKLEIIGDGVDREMITKAITDNDLANVFMRGRLKRQQVMNYYKICDALIMPSLYEAQPLVLLEAMAAKIPIIGTNVIGVVDHLKGIGIITEPTAKGLAYGIEQYDKQYKLLPEMVARGYAKAEGFRWVHTLSKYEAVYEEIS